VVTASSTAYERGTYRHLRYIPETFTASRVWGSKRIHSKRRARELICSSKSLREGGDSQGMLGCLIRNDSRDWSCFVLSELLYPSGKSCGL
jgi:hypothetical protein